MSSIEDKQYDTLWIIVKSLYRGSLLGFALLTLSLPIVFMTDQIYPLHNAIIPMDRLTYNAMMFRVLVDMKILVFIFLLLPAIGLHWTLRKEQPKPKMSGSS